MCAGQCRQCQHNSFSSISYSAFDIFLNWQILSWLNVVIKSFENNTSIRLPNYKYIIMKSCIQIDFSPLLIFSLNKIGLYWKILFSCVEVCLIISLSWFLPWFFWLWKWDMKMEDHLDPTQVQFSEETFVWWTNTRISLMDSSLRKLKKTTLKNNSWKLWQSRCILPRKIRNCLKKWFTLMIIQTSTHTSTVSLNTWRGKKSKEIKRGRCIYKHVKCLQEEKQNQCPLKSRRRWKKETNACGTYSWDEFIKS